MIRHKLIALYEMITGVFGVIIIITNLISQNLPWSNIKFIIGIVLYSFIAYSGYLLMYKPVSGVKVSLAAQIIQTIVIKIQGLLYGITASAYLYVSIGEKGTKLTSGFKIIDFYPAVQASGDVWGMIIYIVPLILIVILLWKKKQLL